MRHPNTDKDRPGDRGGECESEVIADINGPQRVEKNSTAHLSGSDSCSVDASITSYKWKVYRNGSFVDSGSGEEFETDVLRELGEYEAKLDVEDTCGEEATDTHRFAVIPADPDRM